MGRREGGRALIFARVDCKERHLRMFVCLLE